MYDDIFVAEITGVVDSDVVRQIARLHCKEIPDGFLSSLGEEFLTRLYSSLISSKDVVLFAAVRGNAVLGYICASTHTTDVYREFLLRHSWRVAPLVIRRLISRRAVRRVLETLLYPSKTRMSGLPDAEILNFCVSAQQQRLGIGKRLFSVLTNDFEERRIDRLRIVTGAAQASAQKFYESIGAEKVANIEVHGGSPSFVYVYQVIPQSAAA